MEVLKWIASISIILGSVGGLIFIVSKIIWVIRVVRDKNIRGGDK